MGLEDWDYKNVIEHAQKMQAKIVAQAAEIENLKKQFGVLQEYQAPKLWHQSIDSMSKEQFDREVEAARPMCEANDAAYQANLALMRKLAAIISAAGFDKSTRRLKGRSQWKTEEVDCEWYSLLKGAVRSPSCTVSWLNTKVEEVKRKRAEAEAKQAKEQRQREIEASRAEAERKKTVAVVEVAKELGVDPVTADADSLIEELRSRDKYIDLAKAMADTRGDWSDGFYRVTGALGRFKPESEVDIAIVSEVSELAHGDESDGRIFRDCTWNYSRVYELADPVLRALYSRLTND